MIQSFLGFYHTAIVALLGFSGRPFVAVTVLCVHSLTLLRWASLNGTEWGKMAVFLLNHRITVLLFRT